MKSENKREKNIRKTWKGKRINYEIKGVITPIKTSSTGKVSEGEKMPADVTVVLGAQWGDEGKGKLVDALLAEGSIDLCCRCQVSKGNFYFNLNNRPKIILI
jgi:hypothetical protein